MERVYLQVKRIIDNIDFNKLYKGFNKLKFLIKYQDYLFGLTDLIKYNNQDEQVIINGDKYVIYDLNEKEINIKNIVIEIVCKMFNIQYPIKEYDELKLRVLIEEKNSEYYTLKYQLNLLSVNILKGNNSSINDYLSLNRYLKNNYSSYSIEKEIENNIGIKKYIYLKLLLLFKPDEYNYELRHYFNVLEDPCKLLNYMHYIEEFSVVNLLIQNIIKNTSIKETPKEIEKPLFSFNKLLLEKDKQIKKILMHKMIHAKKTSFKGKLKNINFNKVLVSDNLFYLPNEITYEYNNRLITKKGDYILKINKNLEIEEGYECFSIEKILA